MQKPKVKQDYYFGINALVPVVQRHFRAKGVDLPPELPALVAIGCWPNILAHKAFEMEHQAFAAVLSRTPALAFDVIDFVRRKISARSRNAAAVIHFIVHHNSLAIRPDGSFCLVSDLGIEAHYPFRNGDARSGKLKVEHGYRIIAHPQDGEIAQLLGVPTHVVRDTRRALLRE